jgi:hypothetical protein
VTPSLSLSIPEVVVIAGSVVEQKKKSKQTNKQTSKRRRVALSVSSEGASQSGSQTWQGQTLQRSAAAGWERRSCARTRRSRFHRAAATLRAHPLRDAMHLEATTPGTRLRTWMQCKRVVNNVLTRPFASDFVKLHDIESKDRDVCLW